MTADALVGAPAQADKTTIAQIATLTNAGTILIVSRFKPTPTTPVNVDHQFGLIWTFDVTLAMEPMR